VERTKPCTPVDNDGIRALDASAVSSARPVEEARSLFRGTPLLLGHSGYSSVPCSFQQHCVPSTGVDPVPLPARSHRLYTSYSEHAVTDINYPDNTPNLITHTANAHRRTVRLRPGTPHSGLTETPLRRRREACGAGATPLTTSPPPNPPGASPAKLRTDRAMP